MGLFSDYFVEPRYLNLAEDSDKKQSKRPQSVDSNSSTMKVTKETIKELIESDWFTFATKNISTTMFSKAKSEIISDEVEVWTNFFKNMRLYGNNTSLRRLQSDLKGDMVSYGSAYLEFIPDEGNTEILDLKRIDASKMNNAKDRKGHLILDTRGNSIGYVLSLGSNADLRSKGDKIPEIYADSININVGDIFLSPERIAEFTLYKRANGIEAIGLIEPSVQQTRRRRDLETAQVNAIWIRGTSPLFALVGDNEHEPTPQMLQDALDSMLDLVNTKASSFPHYIKPMTIDATIDDIATTVSNGLLAASASTAGIPLPFVTGQGEATNRSTLKTQRELFEDNIQEKIKNFDEDWNLLVMDKISEINNYPEGKIKSGNIRMEAKDEFAKRLKIYFDMSGLSPKEVRINMQLTEDLILDDQDYKKYMKTKDTLALSKTEPNKDDPNSSDNIIKDMKEEDKKEDEEFDKKNDSKKVTTKK